MIIRRARLKDLNGCAKMLNSPQFIFPGGKGAAHRYLRDFIKKGIFFLAVENGSIAGFISGQITLGKELWIDMLIVKERERGHGIGSHLLKRMLAVAKKKRMKMLFLDAPLFNKRTLGFYKRFGLKQEKKFVWFTKKI